MIPGPNSFGMTDLLVHQTSENHSDADTSCWQNTLYGLVCVKQCMNFSEHFKTDYHFSHHFLSLDFHCLLFSQNVFIAIKPKNKDAQNTLIFY